MSDKKTIAVTCASSRMGQAAVRQLIESGFAPRAISRSVGVFGREEFSGTAVVDGDFSSVDSLQAAFTGSAAILSAIPSLAAEKSPQYAQNLVDAAKRAGVRRIVHNSMMWAPDEPCGQPYYDAVLDLENIIVGSGLEVTIFRPVLFMDNLLTRFAKPNLVEHGLYRYCQKPGMLANWIAMDDVAKFMVAAIDRDDLVGRRIAIGGPETLPVEAVVSTLANAIGRPITYEYEDPYDWGYRVHGEVGLGDLMPRDVYAQAMGAFYTFNNESPFRPFQVDMAPVLKDIPVKLVSLRAWASAQDWSPEEDGAGKVGSVTA
ncbi:MULTISPECIES: SDR family oxidoreductase [Sphingobium]|uniref:SDR family oxidoreductase n=1 Tax=Sphingobium TaxID=165695 RepID=UPI00159C89BB|nr:NmrA family NAD(P)-binding protein [Sphingobium sp. 15-1]